MATLARRSLAQTFAELRLQYRIGLLPFVAAGYPSLDATAAVLCALEKAGASAIELGIPFSDPIADGPTIQEAFATALAQKVRPADVLATVSRLRPSISIPLIAMVSFSIVFRHGPERFVAQLREAGFDALILPDLPLPEAKPVCGIVRAAGLDTILLVAPTTAPQRRAEIASLCSGFIYYLSVSGITGARQSLPPDLKENLRALRGLTQVPVCVGFGISRAEHLAQLAGLADGAIVGSALVQRLKQHADAGPQSVAEAAAAFCRELLCLVR